MKFKILLILFLLTTTIEVHGQKRKKGDRKKEAAENPEHPKHHGDRGSRTTPTTTTTTTTTTRAPVEVVEETFEEDVIEISSVKQNRNTCPPELKPSETKTNPCTCHDNLDEGALGVECVGFTSAEQMQNTFDTLLLGKRINALEVRNSSLGALVPNMVAHSYISTILMRGNNIQHFHVDTFQGTEENIGRLDLSTNQITHIRFSVFENFTQLQVLNLGENQLTTIEDAGKAPSLRVLYLYSNQIDSIAPMAFNGLEALEYLDLRSNNLQVIAPNALQISGSRWQLRIRSNQISSLENAFGNGFLPFLIEISGNNIGILTDIVYGPLTEAALLEGSKLYLSGNPIQCDCSIAWLITNATLMQTIEGAHCDGDGSSITDLKLNEFVNCPPPQKWVSPLAKIGAELAAEPGEENLY